MGRLQLKSDPHVDKPDWWTSDEWGTPQAFIDELVAFHGRTFDLDVCARADNAKAARYYTKADNGLTQPWEGFVWCNPPYSNPKAWVEKAVAESKRPDTYIIMLLPAAVDTGWFHDLVLPNADIRFLRGRLRFIGWKGTPIGSPTAGNVLGYFPKGWK